MNSVLDGFLVSLVVLAGFGYAIYSLGPKSFRPRALRVASAATGKAKASCGGCADCGPHEQAAAASTAAASTAAASTAAAVPADTQTATEVRIPLAKIGKRPSA